MNAKEAREYAQKKLKVVEGDNKIIFDDILKKIKDVIDQDATKTYMIIPCPPKQVIAWLEGPHYQYETLEVRSGPNEYELKISWSEEGIKQYPYYEH